MRAIIHHRGHTIDVPPGVDVLLAVDQAVTAHGPWVTGETRVEMIPDSPAVTPQTLTTDPTPDQAVLILPGETPDHTADRARYSEFGDGQQVHDADAATRIQAAQDAIHAAVPEATDSRDQLYATGTRMAASGYAAQASRLTEHEAKVSTEEAAHALCARITAERRVDVEVSAAEFGRALEMNGHATVALDGVRHELSPTAMKGLLARLDSPASGYVFGLGERIMNTRVSGADRAMLLEVLRHECNTHPDIPLKLRTRGALADVFAVVSPKYVAADAPSVLPDVITSLPAHARATFAYDPASTGWELRASVFTPTPTDEQAVGEPFEGYVSYRSRDNGTSGLTGGGGVLLIACLNASVYSIAASDMRRVHRGTILLDLPAMAAASTQAITALCAAWGSARSDTLTYESETPIPIETVLPGWWRACLTARQGELVGVLPGRRETHVQALSAYTLQQARHSLSDTSVTRADLAQGWTRYAQDFPPEVRREAEAAGGAFLASTRRIGYDALDARG